MMRKSHFLKILPVFLLLTLVLVPGSPVSAEGETEVSISGPGEVNPGEQFTIDIQVTPGEAIAGVQFNLAFDASLFSVDSVTEGDLLTQDGASTYFSAGTINNGTGSVSGVAGAIITPGQTVADAGTFAVVTMTAGTTGGTSSLILSNVVVGDINGQAVAITVTNDQVSINQAPVFDAISEPTSDEGVEITLVVSATDADSDPLVYSASNLPDGASFDPDTRTFSWTPRYDQAGIYVVSFEVSDGQLTDTEDVTITVVQPSDNWDINGDGDANVLDMVLVGQQWDETGQTGWIREDANEDGAVNVLDMIVIGQHWTN